jgi:hypothetical protein
MFALVMLFIRTIWLMLVLGAWLVWALIALTVMLIASATGNHATARRLQRSLRWRHIGIF